MFSWAKTDQDLRGAPHCRVHERLTLDCVDCWSRVVRGMPVRSTKLGWSNTRPRRKANVPLGIRDFPRDYRRDRTLGDGEWVRHELPVGVCRLCGEPVAPVGKRKPGSWHPCCVDLWRLMDAQTSAIMACCAVLEGEVCQVCGRQVRVQLHVERPKGMPHRRNQHERPDLELPEHWVWLPRWNPKHEPEDHVGPEYRELKKRQKHGLDAHKVYADPRLLALNEMFADQWETYYIVPKAHGDHILPLWSADRQDPRHWTLWGPWNLQLLCPSCHSVKTRKEAGTRARARKKTSDPTF